MRMFCKEPSSPKPCTNQTTTMTTNTLTIARTTHVGDPLLAQGRVVLIRSAQEIRRAVDRSNSDRERRIRNTRHTVPALGARHAGLALSWGT
jgi:hypothetical protein